jgi:hypothetical protein
MIERRVSRSWRLWALLPKGAFVLHALSPTSALAQQDDANAAETAAARALAVDGVKLAQAGQCKDAVDKLDRAEKLRHSAIVLGHLGECQVSLGKWVEGSENLRKLLREPLPAEPTPALEQAYQRAAATLKEIKPRIPTLTIVLKAPRDAALSLKLDGAPLPDTVVGVAVPADPGEHTVEIEAPGYLKASASVKLEPGAKESVTLDLKRDPFATAAPKAETAPAAMPSTQTVAPASPALAVSSSSEPDSGTSRILSYVSYGVGAAGLAVGIGFGRAAMQDETDLATRCPNKVCPESVEDDLDSAKTKGMISTIGFGVGAAGVALGTVLLVMSTSGSSSTTQTGALSAQRRVKRPESFRARASIGLGSLMLAGEF